jgi:hypothetical protein
MSDSPPAKRIHYVDCSVEVEAWGDCEAFACDDAEARIEGDVILISYFDEQGIVVLEGRSGERGGWTFMARSRPRRAFLAPMGDSPDTLVGEIDEQGEVTGWQLRLGRAQPRD